MSKIVIAEDDIVCRTLMSKVVEKMGHSAIQCSNGKRAWEIVTDNTDVAMLITDIVMPDMDGKELVNAIRDNETMKNMPIIIVSGVVSYSEIRSILELGASRFMPKPINSDELKNYVKNLLSKKE